MSKSSLKVLAVLLGILIIGVYFTGLDNLPRSLRAQIEPERRALASAQTQLRAAQDEVLRNLQTESDLFQAIPASGQWPEQLSKDLGDLQLAPTRWSSSPCSRSRTAARTARRWNRCWPRSAACERAR